MNLPHNPTSPFLTDKQFEDTFEVEIARDTQILDRYAEEVCPECSGRCCWEVRCRFYSRKFGRCPIYEYRPARCRLYFCSEVATQNVEVASRLSQLIMNRGGLGIFLTFPAEIMGCDWLASSSIKEEVYRTVQALERGYISSESASELLIGLIQPNT